MVVDLKVRFIGVFYVVNIFFIFGGFWDYVYRCLGVEVVFGYDLVVVDWL